jgi:crotonobetainyl-CoA:carnitine CoA-transferase CaiB-like acyl-CoA transferase
VSSQAEQVRRAETSVQALQGLRVVELGGFAAGPVVGKYLVNHGAEVVRIESSLRPDGFRSNYPPFKDNVPGLERAGIFNYYNDGKRSLTLNLKSPRGVELARELVAVSDVVVENFTPGTMARLGLGYEVLSGANPRLVMLSTCNQGQFGPHAGHPGFGSHLTSLSGFTQLLGYPDRTPVLLYGPYIDFIAVGFGVVAVLAALARRRRTGRGAYIDLSQYETGLQFMSPELLDLAVNGRVATRQGNRDAAAVPHGVYPCRGEERWCALSVSDDHDWQRLVTALGSPSWASDPELTTVAGRKRNEVRLDELIAEWTCGRELEGVVELLHQHGVRVYPVNSMADLFSDPQLAARGFWCPVDHPVLERVHVAAPPFTLSDTPHRIERPAPCMGADNAYVLSEILGLDSDEIARLGREGVLD